MKRTILILALALCLLTGCAGQKTDETAPLQKPVVNFEGTVAAVADGSVTLEDGRVILITEQTQFAPDPDSAGTVTVSRDLAVGHFIQGYTEDDASAQTLTAANIWTNRAPAGGRRVINFEGRVAAIADGRATLEDGRIVRIDISTFVSAPDGSAAEVAVGDYIQGYSDAPEAEEIPAQFILVTPL